MGCVQSSEVRPSPERSKKSLPLSPSREGVSSLGLEKDTTASGRNSTRYSPTIWDVQLERERRAAMRTSMSSIGAGHAGTPRGDRSADMSRFFIASGSSQRRFNQTDTPTGRNPSLGLIPAWSQSPTAMGWIERSGSLTRSNSFAGLSPSNRSAYQGGSNCPSTVSPSGRSSRLANGAESSRYSTQRSEYSYSGRVLAGSRTGDAGGIVSSRRRETGNRSSRTRQGVVSLRVL